MNGLHARLGTLFDKFISDETLVDDPRAATRRELWDQVYRRYKGDGLVAIVRIDLDEFHGFGAVFKNDDRPLPDGHFFAPTPVQAELPQADDDAAG